MTVNGSDDERWELQINWWFKWIDGLHPMESFGLGHDKAEVMKDLGTNVLVLSWYFERMHVRTVAL